jgi:8-oxo-dGTP pyrophosphatase MutT (NUDIX family)
MLVDTKILNQCRKPRAGVIPFTVSDGKMYFLFAKDRMTGELSDFGGGCKKNETALDTAIREFKEESNAMFSDMFYTEATYNDTFALSNDKMAIVFLPIYNTWLKHASQKFKYKHNTEVSDVVWIDEDDLIKAVINNQIVQGNLKMWVKIKHFIKSRVDPKKLLIILQQVYLNTESGGYFWSNVTDDTSIMPIT